MDLILGWTRAQSARWHLPPPPMAPIDMTSLQSLRDLIQGRLDAVADRAHYERDPEEHLNRLKSISEQLDRAAQDLPADIDPQLRHYLDRQSYLKAIAWLDQEIVARELTNRIDVL